MSPDTRFPLLHVPHLPQSSEQQHVTSVVKLSPAQTNGAYTMIEQRFPHQGGQQQQQQPPIHDGQCTFCIVRGTFAFVLTEQRTIRATQGDVLHGHCHELLSYTSLEETEGQLLLIVAPEAPSSPVLHRKAGEGRSLAVLTDVGTFLVSGNLTDHAYLLMQWRVPAASGVVMHAQSGLETFYIVEGQFTLEGRQGQETVTLKAQAGDVVHVPEWVAHSYRNTGNTPGIMLVIFAPAGKTQQFFEDIGTPIEDETIPLVQPPLDMARLLDALQRYQVKVFP